MFEVIFESEYFGFMLSLLGFAVGMIIQKRFKSPICNPLLIGIVFVMIVIKILKIPYEDYYQSAQYIGYFLTPATVCLSISLYKQIDALKDNWLAIITGIVAGIVTCMISVLVLAIIFNLSHIQYVTLIPKSITTAIGVTVSAEFGGIEQITVATIVLTGIFGNIIAKPILKAFKITNPIAQGIAIGTSSHAAGTPKAIEMGEVQGAMSGLAISIAGIVTVLLSQIFALIY